MRIGQIKMLQNSLYLLRFGHLFWTNALWTATSLWFISRFLKKLILANFTSVLTAFMKERLFRCPYSLTFTDVTPALLFLYYIITTFWSQSYLLFYWVPVPHPTWRSKPGSSLANILIFLIFFLGLEHGFCLENSGLDSLFSRYSVLFCLALEFFWKTFISDFLRKWYMKSNRYLFLHLWNVLFLPSLLIDRLTRYWILGLKVFLKYLRALVLCVSVCYLLPQQWCITKYLKCERGSVMSNSLWPHELCSPWNSPGQNTGVGSLSLLQRIFPTQRSNPGLPHPRQILYQLSHEGSPRILEWVAYPFSRGSSQPKNQTGVSCIAGGFFTAELPGKPL